MAIFKTEPKSYEKGIMSDLQGAWSCVRDEVVQHSDREIQGQLIFHIDEAMSWESVRDLDHMKDMATLIRNIINHSTLHEEIVFCMDDVSEVLNEVLLRISEGEIL